MGNIVPAAQLSSSAGMKILAAMAWAAVLGLGVVRAASGAEPTERAVERAQALVDRMKAFDAEGVMDLTYTRVFERLGVAPERARRGMRELQQKLKSLDARYTRLELGQPHAPFAGDGNLYVIIPYSGVMELQGKRILQEAFFIGVSEDAGKAWKFVDGINSTQESIRTVIPSYSGAPLPPRRTKPIGF